MLKSKAPLPKKVAGLSPALLAIYNQIDSKLFSNVSPGFKTQFLNSIFVGSDVSNVPIQLLKWIVCDWHEMDRFHVNRLAAMTSSRYHGGGDFSLNDAKEYLLHVPDTSMPAAVVRALTMDEPYLIADAIKAIIDYIVEQSAGNIIAVDFAKTLEADPYLRTPISGELGPIVDVDRHQVLWNQIKVRLLSLLSRCHSPSNILSMEDYRNRIRKSA